MARSTFAWALLAALHLGTGTLAAQALPAGSPAVAGVLTEAQAREDFDVLRRSLEEAHTGLYRYSARAELDRHFDALRSRLDHEMPQREFIGIISEMLAAVRCGHTRLEYDSATTAALAGARVFPLRVLVEDARIRVMYNDTPGDSAIRPGMEVASINGRSAEEVIGLILPRLPGDGFIQTGKTARLSRSFASLYWLFVAPDSAFTVTARDAEGRTVTASLPGVPSADRTRNQNPVNVRMAANLAALDGARDNVSLRLLSDPGIAHLRIRAFDGDSFPRQVQAAFLTLREQGTGVLILDLRGNVGGVDTYGALLASHFTDRPFRYFDRIHVPTIRPSFATWKPSTFEELAAGVEPDPEGGYRVTPRLHPGVGEQAPAATPFLGRVIVLLDGGTFSTAADVAAVLRHWGRATFVGQETGGGYQGNSSGLNALVILPNSRLRLKIPMYGYWTAVAGGENGRGVIPDHPVAPRTADLLRGVDAQWELALSLAQGTARN